MYCLSNTILAMSLLPRSHKVRGQIERFLMGNPEMDFRVKTAEQPFLREVNLESLAIPRTTAKAKLIST